MYIYGRRSCETPSSPVPVAILCKSLSIKVLWTMLAVQITQLNQLASHNPSVYAGLKGFMSDKYYQQRRDVSPSQSQLITVYWL